MTGYACNQQSMYQGCNCHSLCQPYTDPHEMYYHHGYGCQGHCSGGCGEEGEVDECGMKKKKRKHKKKKKNKKKFRFSEEEEASVVDNESYKKKKPVAEDDDDELPLPPTSEEEAAAARNSKKEDKDWEDDEKWERKFVSRTTTPAPRPAAPSGGLGGLGLGNGGLFGISSGIGVGVPGVGPIGVSSGLGIG
ncbi:hypothetical protein CRE_11484 [Caenorhabditis remanei]|uniref:Uncharacterized protein n=1 Tax=Caenorhabditis remanei TaxID=31234 RepID=E3NER1_CAERE|nr:hypothetical protein CRE_11484 [Caenorhabditis remanei]